MTTPLSNCCNRFVQIISGKEETSHYRCGACGKACDTHVAAPSSWPRFWKCDCKDYNYHSRDFLWCERCGAKESSVGEGKSPLLSACCGKQVKACDDEICHEDALAYGYDCPMICSSCNEHCDYSSSPSVGDGKFSPATADPSPSLTDQNLQKALERIKELEEKNRIAVEGLDRAEGIMCGEYCGIGKIEKHHWRCEEVRRYLQKIAELSPPHSL